MRKIIPLLLAFQTGLVGSALADDASPPLAEEAVRQMVKSYEDAFNKRDANGLADLWSSEAVYVNRSTGEQVKGKAAIADAERGRRARISRVHRPEGRSHDRRLLGSVRSHRRQVALRSHDG